MLIVIPKDVGVAAGSAKFRVALDEPRTVLYVVYGDDDKTPRMLELATAFADESPDVRQPVWVPDPAVLDAALRGNYAPAGKAAVSIGFRDKVALALTATQALGKLNVLKAYVTAENQR